ncbi:MAG: SIS domain-containing protein [Thermanaerothrix sp.]|uniref:SIS domain-containing protein n=1 Tax=Thermanaerothrix solaris TaxID=3058434 RepID=A0ABU3NJL1_9CHLR|nr:SIS domain-containing protein [Thermanaerothrix sp. 4228-RoL]MDT8897037.1 SIS domain-containing protein [Thermanaerothrix sp. 4228-RoL]
MKPGDFTYHEITTQTEAWVEALDVVERSRTDLTTLFSHHYSQVIFTGCGSTYYLSKAAAALFQECTGRIARAAPAGELLLNERTILPSNHVEPTLLIAISRSGTTTETLRAVERFKTHHRGKVLVITNYADRPLPQLADLSLIIEKGQEESIAQTRSFASMYVAAVATSLLAGEHHSERSAMYQLAEKGQTLLSSYASLAQEIGENLNFDRFYFLGSGIRYGLACEANLKMKEMTLTHSEPFHFLEFRHGPMSMVGGHTVVVGLLSESNFPHEWAVLEEMQSLGARILSLANRGDKVSIKFHSHLPELVYGVLYLPVLQLMAYYRALAKGLDPDRPTHLSAVVELDTL